MEKRSDRFRKLLASRPDHELYNFSLAQALLDEGSPAEALEPLGLCCRLKQDWMMAHILLGKTLLQLGRGSEARPVFEHALSLAIAQDHEDPAAELEALLADLREVNPG